MRLGQTSIILLFSKFGMSAFGFLATVYFTRTLGEEIYGFYVITLALVSWLGLVKSVGFGNAIVKRMSEGDDHDAYLAAGAAVKFVLITVVIAGVFFFREEINAYVGYPVAPFVAMLLVATVFAELAGSALKGTHKVHIYGPLTTLREAARSVSMILLVLAGWELTGMLFGYVIGTLFAGIIGLIIVRPTFVIPSIQHVVRLFDFAKYAWLGSMRGKAFNETDILVLGFFVSSGLTGIYAVAYSLSKFLEVFGAAINTTLFPELSKLSAENDQQMVATLTNDALTFAGLFLIPGVVGAAIIGDRVMRIYGPSFDAGHWILVILLLGLIVYTYTRQLLNTLNAIDRPNYAFWANGAFILTNVILNVLLVSSIGWFGAAIATTLSTLVGFSLSLHYLRQFLVVNIPIGEMMRQWVAAICMGIVIFIARYLGEQHILWISKYNSVFVILLVGCGAMTYFIILLFLSNRFRTTVQNNLMTSIFL